MRHEFLDLLLYHSLAKILLKWICRLLLFTTESWWLKVTSQYSSFCLTFVHSAPLRVGETRHCDFLPCWLVVLFSALVSVSYFCLFCLQFRLLSVSIFTCPVLGVSSRNLRHLEIQAILPSVA